MKLVKYLQTFLAIKKVKIIFIPLSEIAPMFLYYKNNTYIIKIIIKFVVDGSLH